MQAALRNALSEQSPHAQLWPPGVLSPLWWLCSCLLTRGGGVCSTALFPGVRVLMGNQALP